MKVTPHPRSNTQHAVSDSKYSRYSTTFVRNPLQKLNIIKRLEKQAIPSSLNSNPATQERYNSLVEIVKRRIEDTSSQTCVCEKGDRIVGVTTESPKGTSTIIFNANSKKEEQQITQIIDEKRKASALSSSIALQSWLTNSQNVPPNPIKIEEQ